MDDSFALLIFVVGIVIGVIIFSVPLFFADELGDGTLIPRFVRVDAEQEEAWCEEWVCEAYAEPYCFFDTPLPCNHCIWGKTPVDENGKCPDGITRVTECVSEKLVRKRC